MTTSTFVYLLGTAFGFGMISGFVSGFMLYFWRR